MQIRSLTVDMAGGAVATYENGALTVTGVGAGDVFSALAALEALLSGVKSPAPSQGAASVNVVIDSAALAHAVDALAVSDPTPTPPSPPAAEPAPTRRRARGEGRVTPATAPPAVEERSEPTPAPAAPPPSPEPAGVTEVVTAQQEGVDDDAEGGFPPLAFQRTAPVGTALAPVLRDLIMSNVGSSRRTLDAALEGNAAAQAIVVDTLRPVFAQAPEQSVLLAYATADASTFVDRLIRVLAAQMNKPVS